MPKENRPSFFDTLWDLIKGLLIILFVGLVVRGLFSAVDAVAGLANAKSVFDLFRAILSIPPVAWVVQLLVQVKYTTALDALLDVLFLSIIFFFPLLLITRAVFPIKWRAFLKASTYMLGATHLQLPHPVVRAWNGTHKVYGASPQRALGPGIVISDGVTALAIEKKNAFTRILGPGFHFLEIEERVQAAIDLRPQSLRRTVTASTREGIEVEIDLSVNTEIERGSETSIGFWGYPFDSKSVYKAIYAEHAHSSETPALPPAPRSAADWCETIATICEDALRHIVAGYTLDQLLAVDNPNVNPRQELVAQLKQIAGEQVGRYGGSLRSVSVSHIRPPRAVLEQRIQNWLADWQRRERTLKALGEARRTQLEESARALAQAEMLQSLGETLALPSEGTSIEILSLRLIEALEKMAREPGTGAQLDTDMIEFLHKLTELLSPKPPEETT
jgi:regulator of protease activity HflC (stomatin/prohibitin superfamily)